MIRSFERSSYGTKLLIVLLFLAGVLLASRAAIEHWTRPEIHITTTDPRT